MIQPLPRGSVVRLCGARLGGAGGKRDEIPQLVNDSDRNIISKAKAWGVRDEDYQNDTGNSE